MGYQRRVHGVTTKENSQTLSMVSTVASASDPQTYSERCEDLEKQNALLVRKLQAAAAAGFVVPSDITTQQENTSTMTPLDLPRQSSKEDQWAIINSVPCKKVCDLEARRSRPSRH